MEAHNLFKSLPAQLNLNLSSFSHLTSQQAFNVTNSPASELMAAQQPMSQPQQTTSPTSQATLTTTTTIPATTLPSMPISAATQAANVAAATNNSQSLDLIQLMLQTLKHKLNSLTDELLLVCQQQQQVQVQVQQQQQHQHQHQHQQQLLQNQNHNHIQQHQQLISPSCSSSPSSMSPPLSPLSGASLGSPQLLNTTSNATSQVAVASTLIAEMMLQTLRHRFNLCADELIANYSNYNQFVNRSLLLAAAASALNNSTGNQTNNTTTGGSAGSSPLHQQCQPQPQQQLSSLILNQNSHLSSQRQYHSSNNNNNNNNSQQQQLSLGSNLNQESAIQQQQQQQAQVLLQSALASAAAAAAANSRCSNAQAPVSGVAALLDQFGGVAGLVSALAAQHQHQHQLNGLPIHSINDGIAANNDDNLNDDNHDNSNNINEADDDDTNANQDDNADDDEHLMQVDADAQCLLTTTTTTDTTCNNTQMPTTNGQQLISNNNNNSLTPNYITNTSIKSSNNNINNSKTNNNGYFMNEVASAVAAATAAAAANNHQANKHQHQHQHQHHNHHHHHHHAASLAASVANHARTLLSQTNSSIQQQQQMLATTGFNPLALVNCKPGQQTEILTPTHLRKAKLMFFYVRYPSSNTLKESFRDVHFNKNNTAQLVKWFSNFREFYYIQMEKFARQAVEEGVACKEDLQVDADHELLTTLNNHYNKNRHIELPEVFRQVVEETLRHFFDSLYNNKNSEQSWKKTIYKLIARLDQEVPEVFKSADFSEHLE